MGSRVPTQKPSRHNPWDSVGPAPGSLTCLTSAAEHRVRALGVLTDKAPSPAVPLSHIDLFILPNPCTAWIFYLSTCSRTGNAFGRDLSRVKAGEENVLITETLQKKILLFLMGLWQR